MELGGEHLSLSLLLREKKNNFKLKKESVSVSDKLGLVSLLVLVSPPDPEGGHRITSLFL